MDLYLISFYDEPSEVARSLLKTIAHLVDGMFGMRVRTSVTIHDTDRVRPSDYETKVVFSHMPETGRVYKLTDRLYVDESYTSLYFAYPYNLYAIFRKGANHSVWNLVRCMMPIPEKYYNISVVDAGRCSTKKLYVNTSCKPAVFDAHDMPPLPGVVGEPTAVDGLKAVNLDKF